MSYEVRTNHLCLVHQAHLITPTKYDLVGNIWLHLGTHALTNLLIKEDDVRTLESLGYTPCKNIST